MRKRQLTALLLLTAALTGCGSMENTQGKPTGEETRQETEGEKEAKGAEAEKVPGDEPGNETSAGNREVPGTEPMCGRIFCRGKSCREAWF